MQQTTITLVKRHIEDGILWLTKNNPHDNFGISRAMLEGGNRVSRRYDAGAFAWAELAPHRQFGITLGYEFKIAA